MPYSEDRTAHCAGQRGQEVRENCVGWRQHPEGTVSPTLF